jgi:hypothetical protein
MEQKKWNKGAGLGENSSTSPKFVCIVPTPQTSISINEFLIIEVANTLPSLPSLIFVL